MSVPWQEEWKMTGPAEVCRVRQKSPSHYYLNKVTLRLGVSKVRAHSGTTVAPVKKTTRRKTMFKFTGIIAGLFSTTLVVMTLIGA